MAKLLIANSDANFNQIFMDSVVYMFSTDVTLGIPLVGALRVGDLTNQLFLEYQPAIDNHIKSMYVNNDKLFFNYMRIINDLITGNDVTLIETIEYDPLSIEIFLDFIRERYGILSHYITGYESEADMINTDIFIDPDKRGILSVDLERFRYLLASMDTKKDYSKIFFLYPDC